MNDYLAGTLSGITESVITFPGDTVKTRLQSGTALRRAVSLSGIYSGFGLRVLATPITRTMFWGVKSHSSKHCDNEYITSILAGLAQSILDAPVDKYKIHRQLWPELAQSKAIKASLRGYSSSYAVTASRNVPFATIYYFLSSRIGSGSDAVDRASAASIAAVSTHPLDTIKTTVQSEKELALSLSRSRASAKQLMKGVTARSSLAALNLVIGHYMFDLLRCRNGNGK